jgi:hypothetical protein
LASFSFDDAPSVSSVSTFALRRGSGRGGMFGRGMKR